MILGLIVTEVKEMTWHQVLELEVVEVFLLQVGELEVQLEVSLGDQAREQQLDDVVVEDLLVGSDNHLVVLEVVHSLDYSHDCVLCKKNYCSVVHVQFINRSHANVICYMIQSIKGFVSLFSLFFFRFILQLR